jgi:hypothetical protein
MQWAESRTRDGRRSLWPHWTSVTRLKRSGFVFQLVQGPMRAVRVSRFKAASVKFVGPRVAD